MASTYQLHSLAKKELMEAVDWYEEERKNCFAKLLLKLCLLQLLCKWKTWNNGGGGLGEGFVIYDLRLGSQAGTGVSA